MLSTLVSKISKDFLYGSLAGGLLVLLFCCCYIGCRKKQVIEVPIESLNTSNIKLDETLAPIEPTI
jgi:hypothetical protein